MWVVLKMISRQGAIEKEQTRDMRYWPNVVSILSHSTMQSQMVVTAYFTSKQLPFCFASNIALYGGLTIIRVMY